MRIKIMSGEARKEKKSKKAAEEQCSCSSHGSSSCADIQEQVRQKAYELYEQRGCQPGHELEDWFEAEKMCAAR